MFTFSGRFRRRVAVLLALSLVASVLVVAAPAAAADPEADFEAQFDACAGVGSSDFTDVPAGHDNAGDIDCIAYYGITKGTSASTYSPHMSVTREQMALFLTRLAGLVGIEMVSDPSDPGFTDIGGLSDESQTAIGQLADLEITKGTSDTTYSPEDNVQRGHMALFIARLMNKMNTVADGSTKYGWLPSDVAKNTDKEKPAESPFTDLGTATKDAYDAITQLWELGVASGISATSYAPNQEITRAAMAGFMAGVLDHSNARPAGLSLQTNKASDFGDIADAVVMVSYRSDNFAPMEDMRVDVFSTDDGFEDDGTCKSTADAVDGLVCEQDDNDPATDEMGNIFLVGSGASAGKTNVYYAWIGDSGDKFDIDDVDEVSASIASSPDAAALKLTTTINAHAAAVDLDVTKSVTLTVRLQDGDGKNVAKADQSIQFDIRSYSSADRASGSNNLVAVNLHTLKTDAEGMVTYTVDAPRDATAGDGNDERYDTIVITSGTLRVDANPGTDGDQDLMIDWLETDPTLNDSTGRAVATVALSYSVISGTGSSATARVPVTVSLYDQYGNLYKAAGQTITFTSSATGVDFGGNSDSGARRAAGGRATYTFRISGANSNVQVTWGATVDDGDDDAATTVPTVTTTDASVVLVSVAGDDSEVPTATAVTALYDKQNKFRMDGTLYSYDSDDLFYQGGKPLSLDQFETKLMAETPPTVRIPSYDDDGTSIFVLTAPTT